MKNIERTKKLIVDLRTAKKDMAKVRDRLRKIQSDAEELLDGMDDDLADLEGVIDNFSKYV